MLFCVPSPNLTGGKTQQMTMPQPRYRQEKREFLEEGLKATWVLLRLQSWPELLRPDSVGL